MPTPLQLWPLARFVRCALGEISTDDHLGHDPIRARSEPIADTGIYIEASDLEIDHGKDVLLLLVPRLEAPERPDIGVVLDPAREALAEAAGEAPARSKDGLPSCPKLRSTIGLKMNSQLFLRQPTMGLISMFHRV